MATMQDINVGINADARQYMKAVQQAEAATRSFKSQLESLKTSVVGSIESLKTFAVSAVGAFTAMNLGDKLRSAVETFAAREMEQERLKAALRSTGQEVERNSAALEQFATEMLNATTTSKSLTMQLVQQGISLGLTAEQSKKAAK